MTAEASMPGADDYGASTPQRVASWFLAGVIVLGSAFLWIGIPILGFWLAGQFTNNAEGFLFAALGGVPSAMVLFGWLLYGVNGLYVRLSGGETGPARGPRSPWNTSLCDERSKARRARRPRTLIDVSMTASAVVAMVLVLVWFFFFAHTILAPMQ